MSKKGSMIRIQLYNGSIFTGRLRENDDHSMTVAWETPTRIRCEAEIPLALIEGWVVDKRKSA